MNSICWGRNIEILYLQYVNFVNNSYYFLNPIFILSHEKLNFTL